MPSVISFTEIYLFQENGKLRYSLIFVHFYQRNFRAAAYLMTISGLLFQQQREPPSSPGRAVTADSTCVCGSSSARCSSVLPTGVRGRDVFLARHVTTARIPRPGTVYTVYSSLFRPSCLEMKHLTFNTASFVRSEEESGL